MNQSYEEQSFEQDGEPLRYETQRSDAAFKKLRRPIHASQRSKTPERLHGMHRRRRKRIEW